MNTQKKYKYPKSYHFPWSPSLTNDDRMIESVDHFVGKEVVVTVKMDGENTNIYHDVIHSRSLETDYHPSRTWVNRLQGEIGYQMKPGERICGENVAAEHSIKYKGLESFFYVFSYWIDDVCQSWEDTVVRCAQLGLVHVPVLYKGVWDEDLIKGLFNEVYEGNEMEGYVCRLAASYKFKDFHKSLAKYVRSGHVQTDEHWKKKPVVWNGWKC